jgi:ABC-type oligopeptide transport system ATPase subunit
MSKGGLINFYDLKAVKEMRDDSHNPHFDETNIEIPSRICIVGASGSGKSTCLMNFILKARNTFGHITIVTKQQEPLYDYLEKQLKGKNITIHYDLNKLEEPKDFPNKELQNLLIFDDQIAEKNQRKIVDYFIRGRKIGAGITCCYLSQSYYQVPKTIRAQLSYIWLVKIGQKRDLNLILADSGGLVDKTTLMQLYTDATREKFNFLKINLNTVDMNKKFSRNFIDFYLLVEKSEEEEKK